MKTTIIETINKSNGLFLFVDPNYYIYNENKLPKELVNLISNIISERKNNNDNSKTIFTNTGIKEFPNICISFIKNEKDINNNYFRKTSASMAKLFQDKKIKKISILLPNIKDHDIAQIISETVEGVILSTYQYSSLITDQNKVKESISELEIICDKIDPSFDKTVKKAIKIANNVCFTRDLVNMPPSNLNPTEFVKIAKKVSANSNLKLNIFDKKELTEKGMECILGVGRGSIEAPKMIILEYKPKKFKNKEPIVLVGKGITYDSGGINLKPAKGGMIELMKDDMAGAGVVLSVLDLCSQMELDLHVYAILAVSENMPSGSACKPGDILKAYNGKTVEVKNTDAEGRLVLADALSYASKDIKPECMIDVATLTGASIVALGWDITPFLSNNSDLSEKLISSSKRTGEKIWELPLDNCYKRYMQGTISDLKNSTTGLNAGVNTAAIFLKEFVDDDIAWTHFDIGGTVQSKRKMPYEPNGATGSMVRLLFDFLENYQN